LISRGFLVDPSDTEIYFEVKAGIQATIRLRHKINAHYGEILNFFPNLRHKNNTPNNHCNSGLPFKRKNYFFVPQKCVYFTKNSLNLR
jgi:hypothetical protein